MHCYASLGTGCMTSLCKFWPWCRIFSNTLIGSFSLGTEPSGKRKKIFCMKFFPYNVFTEFCFLMLLLWYLVSFSLHFSNKFSYPLHVNFFRFLCFQCALVHRRQLICFIRQAHKLTVFVFLCLTVSNLLLLSTCHLALLLLLYACTLVFFSYLLLLWAMYISLFSLGNYKI